MRWRIVLGVVSIIFLFFLIYPSADRSARRSEVRTDLKQISNALSQYHDAYGSFPPAVVLGADGKIQHSWRALLLEFLEPRLHARYRFDEPWDGPNNAKLNSEIPAAYSVTGLGLNPWIQPSTKTKYVAIVGRRTMWPAFKSLKRRDVIDGIGNTLMLVADPEAERDWLAPKDISANDALRLIRTETDAGITAVTLVDGSVRLLSHNIDEQVLRMLLTPMMGKRTFQGDDWPEELAEPSSQHLRSVVESATLPGSSIVSVLDTPIEEDRNQIWCLTFPLCWNELRARAGGRIQPEQPAPLFDSLNQTSFNRELLDESTWFAAAGPATQADDERILAELKTKFPEAAVDFAPVPDTAKNALRLIALVRKQLPFDSVFDRFTEPLHFASHRESDSVPVRSFGSNPFGDPVPAFEGQVTIADDRGDDNFIVCLKTSGPQHDEILLAMLPTPDTLHDAWETVSDRIKNPNPEHTRFDLEGIETLQIPILDVAIREEFADLQQTLATPIPGLDQPTRIESATQFLQFRLDETGADILGGAQLLVIAENGHSEYDPDRIRRFIFDKPFLLAIRERGKSHPWLLAWIANTELMERIGGEPSTQ